MLKAVLIHQQLGNSYFSTICVPFVGLPQIRCLKMIHIGTGSFLQTHFGTYVDIDFQIFYHHH